MRQRILFVTNDNYGGAERITCLFYHMTDEERFDKRIIIFSRRRNIVLKSLLRGQKVPVYYAPHFLRLFQYVVISCWLFFWRPNYTFSSLRDSNIILPSLASWISPKTRCIVRLFNMPSRFRRADCERQAKSYAKAYKVVCQTEEMSREAVSIMQLNPDRICVLHNPINVEKIQSSIDGDNPYSDNKIHFVAVGRIAKQKDYLTLISAFNIVSKNISNPSLHILGAFDDDTVAVKNAVNNSPFADNISFEGHLDNPYLFMKYSSCYVLSSIFEGLPNSLLDALYLGIPVVSTTCIPFINSIVIDGVNGYKCSVGNVEELALAMTKAISLPRPIPFMYKSATKEDINNLFD